MTKGRLIFARVYGWRVLGWQVYFGSYIRGDNVDEIGFKPLLWLAWGRLPRLGQGWGR
jgi:hypothetical protein